MRMWLQRKTKIKNGPRRGVNTKRIFFIFSFCRCADSWGSCFVYKL